MATRRGRRATVIGAALGAATLLATACTGGAGTPPPLLGATARLVTFDSCDALLDWFRSEAADRVTAYGLETTGPVSLGRGGFAEDSATAGPTLRTTDEASARVTGSAAPGFSTTNVQEAGVGEPDLAVTDGNRLLTMVGGALRVIDLTAPEPTVTATVDIPGGAGQLLVDGDHVLVVGPGVWPAAGVGSSGEMIGDGASDSSMPAPTAGTTLTRVDLGGTPRIVGTIEVEAAYVDARVVDGVARIVTRSGPDSIGFVYPSGTAASEQRALETNRSIVESTTIDDWLPSLTVQTGSSTSEARPAVECGAVDHPSQFSGFDVVTVLGLNLGAGATEPLPSAAVVAGAGTVYASSSTLYVTTERWPQAGAEVPMPMADAGAGAAIAPTEPTESPPSPVDPTTTSSAPSTSTITTAPPTTIAPPTTTAPPATEPTPDDTMVPDLEANGPFTDVHAFAIAGDDAAQYLASGRVRGTVLDQFSLSEHDGRLRMATTVTPDWWGWSMPTSRETQPVPPVTESFVTVLERRGDELATVGQVGGIGRTEQIYSTRFVGDQAYVVTFRRTDPLYVVDLRDPAAPRVAGELKIDGYSSYLQLIGEGRLLGVGQDGTSDGRLTGFAESLFDVSDPSAPTRLAQLSLPRTFSLAEEDHHALLWWGATDTLVVPLASWDAGPGADIVQGVVVSTVADDGITERGRISHPRNGASPGPPSAPCPPGATCIAPDPMVDPNLAPQIERSLVVGERLLTVSSAGVMVNDLTSLTQIGWTPFA